MLDSDGESSRTSANKILRIHERGDERLWIMALSSPGVIPCKGCLESCQLSTIHPQARVTQQSEELTQKQEKLT